MSRIAWLRSVVMVAVALALAPVVAGPARAQVTVTGCSTVTLNGNQYVQYDLTFTNTTSNFYATSVQLVRPFPGVAPDDTCSFVAAAGPPDWMVFGTLWEAPADGLPGHSLDPGMSMSGFTLVATRPCCWGVALHNILLWDDPWLGIVCLQCPTPAHAATWGALKAVYR
jgi:hypothetical protein